MSITALKPVEKQDRVQVVDILRGFALFGILMVNIQIIAQPDSAFMQPQGSSAIATWLVMTFFTSKFYPLFSFLFGLGLSLQMQRAEGKPAAFGWLYFRRLFWLFLIGSLHALLIWDGDILAAYAFFGLFLLACRSLKPRTLVIIAVVLMTLRLAVVPSLKFAITLDADKSKATEQAPDDVQTFKYGSFSDVTDYRVEKYWPRMLARDMSDAGGVVGAILVFFIELLIFADIPALFMLGLAAGKVGLFQNAAERLDFWRRLFWWTFPAGLLLNLVLGTMTLVYGYPNGDNLTYLLLFWAMEALCPLLTFGYISSLVLLSQKAGWLKHLAPAGQMALSNYLTQSIFNTLLFYGYGLGLYGDFPGLGVVGIAIGLYAAQVLISNLWMKRFRFGPFEWVWRSLTYWKLQPLRNPAVSQ